LRAEHCGHILVLSIAARGDFILVGDLMKSIALLQCSDPADGINELARDFNANWMTSVAFLDDDTFLGAENSFNIFVTRKNTDATTEDEQGRLEVVGEYHVGEFINRFRKGSLAMQAPETGAIVPSTLLFGTVNGVLGLVASISTEEYALLAKVQTQLTKVIRGVGGFSHAAWRSFCNERKMAEASNILDGDLIEQFLELGPVEMERVADGVLATVEELTKRIEDLARLH